MLFIRRGTRAGVVSGMLAGVATIFLFKLFTPFSGSDIAQSFTRNLDLGLIGCTVNVIVFVIVSKFTPSLNREHIASLSKDMDSQ